MAPVVPAVPQVKIDKKTKTIFQLDSPFTTVKWPQVSPQNQDTVLELLSSLLSPIGRYRASHVAPSQGKRKRKKKRKREAGLVQNDTTAEKPPPPELCRFIAIGLNSITRLLETSSQKSKPKDSSSSDGSNNEASAPLSEENQDDTKKAGIEKEPHLPFSVIFVSNYSPSDMLHAYLPQLLATASVAHPESPPTRLIQLPKGSEERLNEALGLPRVSFIGILEGAPHSQSLVDLIRDCVPLIEIPWLVEMQAGKYIPVKINTIQACPVSRHQT